MGYPPQQPPYGQPQQPYSAPHAPGPPPQQLLQGEHVIWEGVSHSLTSAATGGRVAPKYRLTSIYLHFERGTLSTNAQQVPVHLIADVDVKQTMTQKARQVGDVIVWVAGHMGRERVTLESIQDPRGVQHTINQAAQQARHREAHAARAMQYPMPVQMVQQPQSAAAPQAQPSGEDLVAQLERLAALVQSGALTREEFEAAKAELLRRR